MTLIQSFVLNKPVKWGGLRQMMSQCECDFHSLIFIINFCCKFTKGEAVVS
jgi:hypothetical protein